MRFLYTLLLSIGCLGISFPGHATNVPVKMPVVTSEYNTVESIVHHALNDHQDITHFVSTGQASSLHTDKSNFWGTGTGFRLELCAFDGLLKNEHTLHAGHHAKAFVAKLIFPQHYFW